MIIGVDDPQVISLASKTFQECQVVVFPTETVYGIGALPKCEQGVKKIYILKSRERSKPLLLHIPSQEYLFEYTKKVDEKTLRLIEAFWPGPLSIVVEASSKAPQLAVTKKGTIGLRMPNEKFFLEVGKSVGPILATSANLSGFPPPIRIEDAHSQFGEKVALYIDAGKRKARLASTVIDMTLSPPCVLRVGAVSVSDVKSVVGDITLLS